MRTWERTLVSLQRLAGVEHEPDPDVVVRRTLLLVASVIYCVAALLWAALYVALDESAAGTIPLVYGLLTAANVGVFVRTGRERWFRDSQLTFNLVLPFLLQVALGGFVPSGAVILWAFTAPLGAVLIDRPSTAHRWFLAFVALLLVAGWVQPLVREGNGLSDDVRLAFLVANLAAVTAIAFVLMRYFATLRERAYAQLREEEQRSERLLLNVLPADVADTLKRREGIIADAYDSVTVLFADMVGFTRLSEELNPVEMVDLLNAVFSYFDGLVERHGVEKVRTVGDAYMVVAGAPRPRPDHADVIATLSLEMLDFVSHVNHPQVGRCDFRIGINSGPAVAGVIGTTKFHYDVWGDAVNVASRMESHGVAGRVHVGPGTQPLLDARFRLEPRGHTQVKGKGSMPTWLLESLVDPARHV